MSTGTQQSGSVEQQQQQSAQTGTQREEFRKYLEHNGVMEMLTRSLAELYTEKERPFDPLDYVKSYIHEHKRPEGDISIVRNELVDTKQKLKRAEEEMFLLKTRLSKYESIEGFDPNPSESESK